MPSQIKPPVGERDHVRGGPHASVALVEYGDYQCPACGEAFEVIRELQEKLGGRMRLVFRNFPLRQAHPHAELAAEAAEAAGAQGKFWEMHDVLYENQGDLEEADLALYAQELGLDVDQFMDDLRSHRFAERVSADFQSGMRSGVNGTPTFYINGERFDGMWDFESLYAALTANIDREDIRRAI